MAIDLKRIQLLSKTGIEWTTDDPVLLHGQIGASDVGSSTPTLRIGDGVRPYSLLPVLGGGGGGSVVFGDPTGMIGLAPVDGIATTVMRSDAAPALSQAIAPTWTGAHTFNGGVNIAGGLQLGGGAGAPGQVLTSQGGASSPIWTTPAVAPTGANPSAMIGLAPLNGVAATFMRSDAAPALDQSIAPTWTGAHTFSGAVNFAGGFAANGSAGTAGHVLTSQGAGLPAVWAASPGAAGPANPSALIGLAAINGVASTFMRSDAAPALNQAIAPTWSGAHTFSLAGTGTAPTMDLASSRPVLRWSETDQSADERNWIAQAEGKTWSLYSASAAGTNKFVLQASRGTGDALTQINVGNATDAPLIYHLCAASVIRGAGSTGLGNLSLQSSAPYMSFYDVTGATRFAYMQATSGGVSIDAEPSGAPINLLTQNVIRAKIDAGGFVRAQSGFGDIADTRRLSWNASAFSYGGAYLSGAVGGYHGLIISDGAVLPTLMSNGTAAGIYNQGDSKWLIYRTTASLAICSYNLDALSFNASSSRAIKRETGAPHRAADILSRLRPIFYRLLADESREQLGMIAEEVHALCPQLSDGKTISYDRLAILLLADWQESHARVQA